MGRFHRTLGVFASGCAVYFAMAACTTVQVFDAPITGETQAPRGSASADGAVAVSSSASSAAGGMGSSSSTSSSSTSSSSGDASPIRNAMADEWHAPGSRLKLMYIEGTDGTKEFRSWFDTERDDACTFQVYTDGSLRCVPPVFANNNVVSTEQVWASPNCTGGRVIIVATGSPPPKNFGEGISLYKVDVVSYNGLTSTGSSGSCAAGAVAGQPFGMTFIPPTALVGGTIKLAR